MRLIAERVSFRYLSSDRDLISDFSDQFSAGSLTALVGPSGSGKSTLLDLLGRVREPSTGSVRLEGLDGLRATLSGRAQHRASCGWVLQNNILLSGRSVLDNVAVAAMVDGSSKRESEDRAKSALSAMDLDNRILAVVNSLSGGEQQRVTIARCLISDSPIILADEPSGNLDSVNTLRVTDSLRAAADLGKIVIIATHDRDVEDRCDRSIAIRAAG